MNVVSRVLPALGLVACLSGPVPAQQPGGEGTEEAVRRIDGYKGIWFDLGQRSEFGSKYSGGLGTYTAKHCPLAVHAPEVEKTFFVYGGTTGKGDRHLLAMASFYDHRSGRVPKPVVVHDKKGVDDPHDNPSLQIDEAGHLWVYVSGRGRKRPGHLYRSREPYSIDTFEHLGEREFTYPQPWWVKEQGFLFLFTKYTRGRELYWSVSNAEGAGWGRDHKLAGMGGHYQVSNERDGRVITAFNMHPGGNVDRRTNLYFVRSDDRGTSWRTAGGELLETPLTDPQGKALVRDYRAEKRLVYMKDIGFDAEGNPVILYLTSASHQPGPGGAPRRWTTAHWTGGQWVCREITDATHNYDMGSLHIEPDGTWRLIAPTDPGPQEHGTGGEVAVWVSSDKGETWVKIRQLTRDSERNHGYVRRPRAAHPGFYGFWADGNPQELSESRLYFTDQGGERVWGLPYEMDGPDAEPALVGSRREPPAVAVQEEGRPAGELVLEVNAAGQVLVAGEVQAEKDVLKRLRALKKVDEGQAVRIVGGRATKWGDIIRVLELCNEAGIWNISFATPGGERAE